VTGAADVEAGGGFSVAVRSVTRELRLSAADAAITVAVIAWAPGGAGLARDRVSLALPPLSDPAQWVVARAPLPEH
jgi:hypothetical protein